MAEAGGTNEGQWLFTSQKASAPASSLVSENSNREQSQERLEQHRAERC